MYQVRQTLESILVANSTYKNQARLVIRLLRGGLLDHHCAECGLEPFWNGKKLTLQLDHKNGIANDHRLTNLQFICPNCHTQTPTYGSKNRGSGRKYKRDYYRNGGILGS